ncbi:DUF2569 domain-containing protein [Paenibacillus xylanilyticus]|uniref:DUF2569 domain-containing protein n=1 Tax=Paenibacillus xylanilyticus TaxID=248903 RepID=A0A7Y6C216_9BACL|nr:DUF2569 domain-containing protein [Paenibacillus xylanilyticus]NUU78751.1 DUF2569 domain-containing protein [Paenibacillus xylanilyticus]
MGDRERMTQVDTSSLFSEPGARVELPGISGLGGWLILIQIGLFASLLLLIVDLSQVAVIMDPAKWGLISDTEKDLYYQVMNPLLWFGIISNVILLIIVIVNLVLLYMKKRQFPRMMITLYIANVLAGIGTWIMIGQAEIPGALNGFDTTPARNLTIRSILTCCIFIPYFLKSVRVKNTFVK